MAAGLDSAAVLEQALAARKPGDGRLDTLVVDPEFLLEIASDRLRAVLPALETDEGRAAGRAYLRAVSSWTKRGMADRDKAGRLASLLLAARVTGPGVSSKRSWTAGWRWLGQRVGRRTARAHPACC